MSTRKPPAKPKKDPLAPKPKLGRNEFLNRRMKSPTRAANIVRKATQADALQLRLEGLTFAQIGARLHCTLDRAHKLVTRAVDEITKRRDTNAEGVRQMELARLDKLQAAAWPLAMGSPAIPAQDGKPAVAAREPDMKAMDRVIRIMQERAKLMGLYPKSSLPDGDPMGSETDAPPAFVQNIQQVIFALPDNGKSPAGTLIEAASAYVPSAGN